MDLGKSLLGIVSVIVLVLLNGFFVAAEFALVSVRQTRMEELANSGSRAAKQVLRALAHLDTYIAATQLGITMASLALGFIGEPAIASLLEPLCAIWLPKKAALITAHGVSVAIAFIIVTALHIVFGELAPKSIALQRPDGTSLWVTAPLDAFLKIFRPFIFLLNATGNAVVRLLGLQPVPEHAQAHSPDEIEMLVHRTREAGLIDSQQEQMVSGVFEFEETVARKVMTPRLNITAVEVNSEPEELIRVVTESGHSRLPVYEETIDNIIGVVHIKDLLRDFADGKLDAQIRDLMRPPYFVPENKRASLLLAEMRRSKMQMAVVRDEYGIVSGLVTIEDLLEEIVGDIQDEYDQEETLITQETPEVWIVDGSMQIEDFNEQLEVDLPTNETDTIGGFVFDRLGHQPEKGETTTWNGLVFLVEQTDGRRIEKVRVTRSAALSLATRPSAQEQE
jgi:CBS domain containing-hemolysin-like protein